MIDFSSDLSAYPQEVVQAQEIEQRMVECGINSSEFTIKYEDDLQSITIEVNSSAEIKSDKFSCIYDATGRGAGVVYFQNTDIAYAYQKFTNELLKPELLESTKKELQKRGLFSGMPKRDHYISLHDYVEALEKHAGYKKGEALQAYGDGILLKGDLEIPTKRAEDLMAIMLYVSVHNGVEVCFLGNGFLGNEKMPADNGI